jgi:phospholipid N-methyltransferase
MKNRTRPMRILELGPGSGAVTVKILERMLEGDELLVCEINPRMMRILKNRLRRLPLFQARKHQIKFFIGPAQELPEQHKFDLIVSAIPFLNFELKTVREIFGKIERLSTSRTVLTYYEHIGIRPISLVCSPPKRRRRMKELDSFFESFMREHSTRKKPVWLNMFPISVYRVNMAAA